MEIVNKCDFITSTVCSHSTVFTVYCLQLSPYKPCQNVVPSTSWHPSDQTTQHTTVDGSMPSLLNTSHDELKDSSEIELVYHLILVEGRYVMLNI